MTTIYWNVDTDGFWDDPANWLSDTNQQRVPNSGDDVVIDRGIANPTITVRDDRSISSIQSSEPLLISAGTLQVNHGGMVDGVTLNGGNLRSDGSIPVVLSGSNSLQNGSLLGGVGFSNEGTLLLEGTADKGFTGNLTNTSTGTIEQQGSGTFFVNGTLNNQLGGVFDFQSDGDLSGNGVINNSGTIKKSSGTDVSRMFPSNGSDLYFQHLVGSTVDAQVGTLLFENLRGSSTGATWDAETDATLQIVGHGFAQYGGTYSGTGGGKVQISGTFISTSGGGTFNFSTGLLEHVGGVIVGQSTGFLNTGEMSFAGSTDKSLSGTLNNNGTLIQSGSGTLFVGGTLNNLVGGVFDFQSDGDMSGNGQIFNSGTFKKSAGTDVSRLFPSNGSDLNFNNLAGSTVNAQVGTLLLDNLRGGSTGANWNAQTGATLQIVGHGFAQYGGTYSGSGAGKVQISGTFVSPSSGGTFNFTSGLLEVIGVTLVGQSTGFLNNGEMSFAGNADSALAGTLNNSGTLIQAGTGTLFVNGTLNNLPGGVFDFQSNGDISGNSQIFNSGTFKKSGGTGLSLLSPSSGSDLYFHHLVGSTVNALVGTLQLDNLRASSTGATWNAQTGATLKLISHSFSTYEGAYSGTGGGAVEYAGGYFRAGGSGATLNFPQGLFVWSGGTLSGGQFQPLTNLAFMTVNGSGDKGITDRFTNQGTIVNQGTGLFYLNGGIFTNAAGALFEQQGDSPLSGTDQFTNAGRFINEGTFRKSAGAGSVTWNTRLENGANGVIEINAGTMNFSRGGSSTGGTFLVSAGSVLGLTGTGDIFDWAGVFTGTGPGLIQMSSLLRGGEGSIPAILNFPQGIFQVTGGQLLGSLVNNGFIDLAASSGVFTRAGITNNGTFIHSGTGDFVLNANSRITNYGLFDIQTDADLVVPGDASGGSMYFINAPTGLLRKSVGLGTTSFRHDGFNKELRFDNTGTVEVQFGTLEFADTVVQLNGNSTLTAGTWIARAFSTISMPNAQNITTNLAQVTLDGLGSSFARINTLNTNAGSFAVTGGREFTTVGNLTNSGELTIGPESDMTVTGNLMETPVSNIVGWWRGNENALDSAGSINGTLSGNTSFSQGKSGEGFQLDGNRDFINLGNPAALRLQDFTISAWVRRDAATTGLIFSYGSNGYGFGIAADGKLFLTTININQVQTTNLQITDQELHHVSVTKLGNTVTFSLDGVTELVAPFATTFSFFTNAAIGGRTDAAGGDFNGLIDEVAVFNRPLTAEEVETLRVGNNPISIGNRSPAIHIEIGGRPSTGQFAVMHVTGTANFYGVLHVDTVGGFGPILSDVYTIFTYAARTGSFFPAVGLSPFFNITIDPTQTQLNVVASAADLSVQSVTVPASASPGDLINISYTVQNLDNIPVVGSWFDSIYLSEDDKYDSADLLIGRVQHTGGLAPLDSYSGMLHAMLPGVVDGNYRVIVIADSRYNVGDSNRANNIQASTAQMTVNIRELTFGASTPLTIHPNEDIYLKLNVPFGGDVVVAASFLNSLQAEFFVKQGDLPTRSSFDFVASDLTDLNRKITIPSPLAGPYYVLLHGREGATGGVGLNLLASNVAFDLQTVSPAKGSNQGIATTVLNGAGFTADTVVELLNGMGNAVATATTRVISQNRLFATFNLVGVPAGTYAVRASKPGFTDTLAAAYQVVVGVPGDVRVDIIVPGSVRGGRIYTGYIDYENVGDTDVVTPVIFVMASSQITFDLSSNPTVLEDRFLAISPEGPAGILAPGQKVRIPFRFYGNNMSIQASTMSPDATSTMDWEALRNSIRPASPPVDWDTIFDQEFVANGNTVGDYVRLLAEAATLYQSRNGTTTSDPDVLHRFIVNEAIADRDASVRGMVFRDNPNQPLGGVTVVLIDESSGMGSSGVTTADGLLRIPNLPAGTYRVSFDGYLPPNNLQTIVVPANGSTPDQTWIVRTGGTIRGRVGVPDGVVLVDEENDIQSTVVATDQDGNTYTATVDENHVYEFRGLPSGTYDLSFRSETTLPVFATNITVVEGARTGLIDLFSTAGGAITGTVKKDTGEPVPGVIVQVSNDPQNPRFAITNALGEYRLEGVTPGTLSVATNANSEFQDVAISNVMVTAGQTTSAVNFVVHFNLGSLTGTITSDGQPVGMAQTSLEDENGMPVKFDLTSGNGEYSLGQIAPGTYTLRVEAFGFVIFSQQVVISDNENEILDVQLSRAGTVSGQVRLQTPSGFLPAARIPLRLLASDGSIVDLQADGAGNYGISNLAIGSYSLALADGSHSTDFEITDPDVPVQVNIDLETGLIHGRIIVPDGVPVDSGITVTLRSGGHLLTSVAAEANGDFSFPIVAPGNYEISFDLADVFLESVTGVSVTAGAITDLGGISSRSSSMTLTIIDSSTGLPIVAEGQIFIQQLVADDLYDSVTALPIDPGGIVDVSHLTPGHYVLRPIFVGKESPQVVVTLLEGQNNIQITLGAAGDLTGTVTDGSMPLEGITVTIYSPSNPDRYFQSITAADGTYNIDLLPDGEYVAVFADLRPDAGINYRGFTQINGIIVSEGMITTQNAVLTPGTTSLEVTVAGDTQSSAVSTTPITTLATLTNAHGIPVAVTLVVLNGGTAQQTLSGLPAGDYILQGVAPGFTLDSQPVTLTVATTMVELLALWQTPGGNALPEASQAPMPLMLAAFDVETFDFSADAVIQSAQAGAATLKRLVNDLLGSFPQRQHPFFGPPAVPHPPDHCPDLLPLWKAVAKSIKIADNQLSAWELRYKALKETLLADALDIGAALIDAAISFSGAVGKLPVIVNELKSSPTLIKGGIYSGLNAVEHGLEPVLKTVDEVGKVFKLVVDTLIGAAKDPTKANEQIPGVALAKATEEAMNAFFELSDSTTIDDFFAKIAKFTTFIAEVSQFSAKIVTLVDTINVLSAKIPVLLVIADPIDKAGAILKVMSASLSAVGNTLGNVNELNNNRRLYERTVNDARNTLNAYLAALANCKDDDEDDTDIPRHPLTPEDFRQLAVVVSSDPNDIVGPAGSGSPDHFMRVNQNFPYMILFENKPEATAPAQIVVITQQLDADLDWSTFELGDFGFGDTIIDVPEGRNFYQTRVDLRETLGYFVDFTAGIDLETGIVSWRFESIDPETGDLVENALSGFLPPNDASGRGQGFVDYSISPKANLTTGAAITAQASIVFDDNAPLLTPVYTNKIDTGLPTSSITTLPATQDFPTFTVSWSGMDDAAGPAGSGIVSYDIYVSDNGGSFQPFLLGTQLTTALFTGQVNHTYSFYSVATDAVGFRQTTPLSGQSSTQVLDVPFDFGDAPDPLFSTAGRYPTLLVHNGPRHHLGSGLFFGAGVDREFDGQPNANATGDDISGSPDDEDGVTIPNLIRGSSTNATVLVSMAGKLDAWIDFNRDGDWDDPGEKIADSLPVVAGMNIVSFSVPGSASLGSSYARFRLSTTGGLGVTGEAAGGEVEDLKVQITSPLVTQPGTAVTWIKRDPPVVVVPQSVVPSNNLANGTLTIEVDAIGTSKKLFDTFNFPSFASFGTSAGPQFANGKLTLQIQLNGSVTPNAVQTFLRGITFSTEKKGLKSGTRTLQISLLDSTGASSTATQTINVLKKAPKNSISIPATSTEMKVYDVPADLSSEDHSLTSGKSLMASSLPSRGKASAANRDLWHEFEKHSGRTNGVNSIVKKGKSIKPDRTSQDSMDVDTWFSSKESLSDLFDKTHL